jgi:hypothetical protein
VISNSLKKGIFIGLIDTNFYISVVSNALGSSIASLDNQAHRYALPKQNYLNELSEEAENPFLRF